MRYLIFGLVSVAIGVPLGWYLVKLICGLPMLQFSVVCGHNAYIWLLLTLPAGVCIVWLLLGKIIPSRKTG